MVFISWKSALECFPLSRDISALHFFWNFKEDIYADDSKTAKELKDAIASRLGHPPAQIVDEDITDPETVRLPAVTLCKGAQTGVIYSKCR